MTTSPVPSPMPSPTKDTPMLPLPRIPAPSRSGRVNWTVLSWAIGIPLPIVLIIALMRGCG